MKTIAPTHLLVKLKGRLPFHADAQNPAVTWNLACIAALPDFAVPRAGLHAGDEKFMFDTGRRHYKWQRN